MAKFVYCNFNPKQLHTNDCMVRALAYFFGVSWRKAFLDIIEWCADRGWVDWNYRSKYNVYLAERGFERHKTLLTFDPQGHWTGNENAQFKTGNITRDKDGRISKLTYSYLINKEEDYGYQYDYTYKYDAAGRLKAMGEEYVGELSGGFEYLFTYDDAGEVISYTQDGGGDGVEVESTYTITVLDRDDHGNWTRRLQKEVCTTEEAFYD